MENARLFSQMERRAEQFRVLTEVSQHIISLTSVDELLRNIARTVKESLDISMLVSGWWRAMK